MNTSVPSLVTIENDVPLADSRQIAEKLGMKPLNFRELLQDKQEFIEKHFGLIRFLTEAVKIPGQRGTKYVKYALLTEEQSYYALTFCENTDAAMELRAMLIKAFMDARKRLAQLTTQPAPLYLDTAYIIELEQAGLTPRCIRMVSLMTQMVDLWQTPDTNPRLSDYLMDQFTAEAEAMTPEDNLWGRQKQLTTKRARGRLK